MFLPVGQAAIHSPLDACCQCHRFMPSFGLHGHIAQSGVESIGLRSRYQVQSYLCLLTCCAAYENGWLIHDLGPQSRFTPSAIIYSAYCLHIVCPPYQSATTRFGGAPNRSFGPRADTPSPALELQKLAVDTTSISYNKGCWQRPESRLATAV
jgi:hypothetical protein